MNLKEAHAILGVEPGISPEDAKKKYRDLTKRYHPDINKEEGAEDRFKKINEAYQCVINGKGSDPEPIARPSVNPFQNISDFRNMHNPFGSASIRPTENVSLKINISFKESVLGCQKEIFFTRKEKCVACDGQGSVHTHNGCDKCGGKGQIVGRQGNMIFSRTCDKCMGQNMQTPCDTCSTTGSVSTQVSGNVQIPGGVLTGNILRLSSLGNYAGSILGSDQYSETHLNITVNPVEGMRLEGQDVVSELNVSLYDALSGCSKSTNTIMGDEVISLPRLIKNKDEIKIPNLGVNGSGFHRVIVNVDYPDDSDQIDNLINVLNGYATYDPDNVDTI